MQSNSQAASSIYLQTTPKNYENHTPDHRTLDTGGNLRLHFADGALCRFAGREAGIFSFITVLLFLCCCGHYFDVLGSARVAEAAGGFGTKEIELRHYAA